MTRSETSAERAATETMPFLAYLYIWSIVLDPLLIFVLFDASVSGFTGNVSKLLQFSVILGLGLHWLTRLVCSGARALSIEPWVISISRDFRVFYFLAIVAGIIGATKGAYEVGVTYNYEYTEFSEFSKLINSSAVRPIFEYLIVLYYFCYYVLLGPYLLSDRKRIDAFFSLFRTFFIASLILGTIDFALMFVGVNLLPRNLTGETWIAGLRFHGLAGEPRDAFVYLMLGLAVLQLREHLAGRPLSARWLIVIGFAAVATQSASGIVGLLIFAVMYALYGMAKLRLRVILFVLAAVIGTLIITSIAVTTSDRIAGYVAAAEGLWDVLEEGVQVSSILYYQMNDIFPMYDMTVKVRQGDIIPLIIGSGFGSASAINNQIPGLAVHNVTNPHSQVVRLVYETGLVGLLLFVRVFVMPTLRFVRSCTLKVQTRFMLAAFLVLGCSLGHKSSANYIYLGLVLAATRLTNVYPRIRTSDHLRGRGLKLRPEPPIYVNVRSTS